MTTIGRAELVSLPRAEIRGSDATPLALGQFINIGNSSEDFRLNIIILTRL